MTDSTLYDDDILLWSEQQAAAIRKLARVANGLPNELDIENVAEEIESVGRSELASVKSYIRLIFVHLMKVAVEQDSSAAFHWRGEVFNFRNCMMDRYAPSMRQRLHLDALWSEARQQLLLSYIGDDRETALLLPERCPFELDDLLAARFDCTLLVERLNVGLRQGAPR